MDEDDCIFHMDEDVVDKGAAKSSSPELLPRSFSHWPMRFDLPAQRDDLFLVVSDRESVNLFVPDVNKATVSPYPRGVSLRY